MRRTRGSFGGVAGEERKTPPAPPEETSGGLCAFAVPDAILDPLEGALAGLGGGRCGKRLVCSCQYRANGPPFALC